VGEGDVLKEKVAKIEFVQEKVSNRAWAIIQQIILIAVGGLVGYLFGKK
jgi:hypothetical protein